MQKKLPTGFTLIELMVIVAIIGILAAIAIPTYNINVKKAKISEAILQVSTARTCVTEINQSALDITTANYTKCQNIFSTTQYIQKLTVSISGIIEAEGNVGEVFIIKLTPSALANVGSIKSWICSGTPTSIMPSSCRNQL